MVAINCDDSLARCEEGNMFRANSSTLRGTVEARVNGLSTGPLPHGERMILPNDLAGTTGQLDLILGGQSYPICERLQDYNFTQPRDLGLLISEVKDDASTNSGGTEQDLLLLAVPPALMSAAPPEGEIDIDQAPDTVLLWAAVTILAGLEVLDEVSGTQALFEATGEIIDLRSTGTDGAPTLADVVAAVRSRNGRAAIRAMLDGGAGALRVLRDGAGRLMVLARMQPGLARQLMAGVVVSMTRNRMAVVTAGTRGQLGSRAAATPASRIPVVGFFIVGTIDVIEWYSNPDSRGDWPAVQHAGRRWGRADDFSSCRQLHRRRRGRCADGRRSRDGGRGRGGCCRGNCGGVGCRRRADMDCEPDGIGRSGRSPGHCSPRHAGRGPAKRRTGHRYIRGRAGTHLSHYRRRGLRPGRLYRRSGRGRSRLY